MLQQPTRPNPTSGHNPQSLSISAVSRKLARAKKQYIRWLNKNHPKILRRALDEAGMSRKDVGLSGFGQYGQQAGQESTSSSSDDKAWYDKLLDYVPTAVQAYGAYEQQKNLIELNEKRAKQGLPPLNQPPAIKVEGEAGPETRKAVQEGIIGATQQYVPLVLGGLVLWVLMKPKGRKR